ncbi:MAG: asparagine synthase (glutamine-hydrolyzing) [Candidatus Melainabacteria bacterium]|mgnify:CR=1 FL=1|nr:asparagine synthase (glutamine-hydrolyzing) [Candidatus Melainabacteria bacterium]
MCGIIAKYSPGKEVTKQSLSAAVTALNHRGPDGHGMWLSPNSEVGLAHARLAIIGLNNGVQPISSDDGQIQIIVNGEFYDFERIRNELKARGHRFSTESDSEIALHLYKEQGVDCLQHLRGEFAMVIWDERAKRLFAARDRFGIKPLVYARINEQLCIASEAKALFALGVPAEWDEESFFQAANMQYTLPDRTLFSKIKQLEPGQYLLANDQNVQTFTYWDLDYKREDDASRIDEKLTPAKETELIEQCREQLTEAIRLRLRADIPVCAHLSGGLDSSAVVALAMQISDKPIKCFSVSFTEEAYDERAIASEMATRAGADFQPVNVSQSDLIEHLSDAVYFSEGLAINGHLTAKYILNKEIRKGGYKVALTGEGSDEVLAGYAHLRSDLYKTDGRYHLLADLHASNTASQGIMLMHGRSLSLDAVQQKLGYVPGFLEAKGSFGHKVSSLLSDETIQRFQNHDAYDRFISHFDVDGQLSGRNHVNQSLYLWTKSALANYILKTLGDGMEMANSIEGRLPFLDHHFFEFVRDLPISMKINGTIEKYILKEAVKPFITDTIYNRQKHPFVAPPISAFASDSAETLLNDSLRSQKFKDIPFLDHKKIVRLLDSLPKMTQSERSVMDPVLMMITSAYCLQDRFGL